MPLAWIAAGLIAVYVLGALYSWLAENLASSPYPSPDEAEAEMARLADGHPALCQRTVIGHSTRGRPIHAFRLHAGGATEAAAGERPALLITAQIHAVEFVGSYVARAVARWLVERYGSDPQVTALLDRADVWIVPLLNTDGAHRVWERNGWSGLGGSRFTANGVDPNRNFPIVPATGKAGWNTASERRGSAYYRGPRPLSEPECLALALLCRRRRFCAAINFHSFGGVVFMPQVPDVEREKIYRALDVFREPFQSRQPHFRYRPVPERSAAIVGQLDPFLLNAFGTVSVTVEVSRLGWHVVKPWRTGNIFWWANPPDPEHWVENDADAAIHALGLLLQRLDGKPVQPAMPELGEIE